MLTERLQGLEGRNGEIFAKIYDVAYECHRNPYDAAHDWLHHEAVLLNGIEIIQKENIANQINVPVFAAAALLHDLERDSKTPDLAVSKMKEAGFSQDFVDEMAGLINEHSFEDKQVSLEGKVLWAADKIEYVSKDRFTHSLENLSKLQMIFYRKLLNSRIKEVKGKFKDLGLKSADEMFLNKLEELKSFIEKEKPEYSAWLKGL